MRATQAAISAMTPTKPSDQHRAVADRPDVATRLSIIFGVVPEAISAWKPEIAPQAIVMKTNGKSGPGTIGPPPCDELR